MTAHARPPGPAPIGRNPLAWIRYGLSIRGDIVSFVGRRFAAYGDIYYAPLGDIPLYVTRNPDHVRQILQTKGTSFEKTTRGNAARQLQHVLGDGLLNANGELWRRHRRMINPGFHRQRVESYAPWMVSYTREMLAAWPTDRPIDVGREMMELTLRIVARALFDHDARSDSDRVAAAMEAFRGLISMPAFIPDWLPIPSVRRAKRALQQMDELVYRLVDERLADADPDRPDLLTALALAVDDDDAPMARKQVRDEILTLFLAGHETTSHALTWTLYLLSRNPDAMAPLRAELDTLTADPTLADLPNLPYTEMALHEGMRLYPPAYVVSRTALEDVDLGDHTIPRGAEILVWIYHVHHDAKTWPDPERFDPTRFTAEAIAARPKGAFIPFGAGTRACIGKHFAMMEARLVLATILRHVDLAHDPAHPVAMAPAVTLAPKHGMLMHARPRESGGVAADGARL